MLRWSEHRRQISNVRLVAIAMACIAITLTGGTLVARTAGTEIRTPAPAPAAAPAYGVTGVGLHGICAELRAAVQDPPKLIDCAKTRLATKNLDVDSPNQRARATDLLVENGVLRWGAMAPFGLGLFLAAGVGADMLSLFDFLSSGEHPLVAVFVAIGLIPAPGVAATIYFLPRNAAKFLYCGVGILFVALGAFQLGAATERSHRTVTTGGSCDTKPYGGEPLKLQVCRRIELLDTKSADLEDTSAFATTTPRDPEVTLSAGRIEPADDSGATISRLDGTYPLSHPGCDQAQRDTEAIDLRDLQPREAICVKTKDNRVAILWLVDMDDEQQSAVFSLTCWKKTKPQ